MDKKRFGQFIKEARLAKRITQAELAEQLFIDVTAVSKWERGINFPDISMISDICRCLGITEHELIESSRDTEYRQLMYNSKRYLLSKSIAFWSITSSFIVAVLICFIVNLCVSHTLSWFFIVLMSCSCGYWGIMYPVLFAKVKKSVSEKLSYYLCRFSLLIYSTGLLLFTLAILFTTNSYKPFDIIFSVKITLYSFLILYIYGIIELFNIGRLSKIGIDSIFTGLYSVSLAKVIPYLMHVKEENYFDVNFGDWKGHTNGNVSVIILVSFAVFGIVFITLGIKKKHTKQNNG